MQLLNTFNLVSQVRCRQILVTLFILGIQIHSDSMISVNKHQDALKAHSPKPHAEVVRHVSDLNFVFFTIINMQIMQDVVVVLVTQC